MEFIVQDPIIEKKAFITGINGQDGSYLAELLLEKGYEVHGCERRVSSDGHLKNIEHIKDKIVLHSCDIRSYEQLVNIFSKHKFTEVYHLAAQSFVADSFKDPFTTYETNFKGTMNILEVIRHFNSYARVYFAGTSEMFGKVKKCPQNEETEFNPQSPYAISKQAGFYLCDNYRRSYDLFICSGILFNHESPRRPEHFVTQKIIKGLYNISMGSYFPLELGNINAKRDWGHSKDYVKAMYLMLQQDEPNDFVISSGETHSVREFVELAAKEFGMEIYWKGKGLHEIGIDKKTDKVIVIINKDFYRPSEVDLLLGDSSKAIIELDWKPTYNFIDLIKNMAAEFKK